MRNERGMEKEMEREVERTEEMRKAKRAGKARRAAVFAGLALILAMPTGCGASKQTVDKPEVRVTGIDVSEREEVKATSINTAESGKEEEDGGSGQSEAGAGNDVGQSGDAQESDKVTGSIKSIGDNSVVISRAFQEAPNILVAPGDGSPDEVLVTVFVSDATTYEVHTVKNGGVNGDADVDKKEGSFSDCKENGHIVVLGSWDGDDFYAVSIIIYRFL